MQLFIFVLEAVTLEGKTSTLFVDKTLRPQQYQRKNDSTKPRDLHFLVSKAPTCIYLQFFRRKIRQRNGHAVANNEIFVECIPPNWCTRIINCYAIVLYLPRAVIRFAVLKLICRPFADGSKPSTFFPCFALRSKWNPISFTIGLVCFQLFVTYDCTSATPSNEPPPCNLLIFSRDFNALPSPKSSLFVKCDEHCARAHQRHGSSDYYVHIQFFLHLFMEVLVPSSASTFPPQLNLNTF